MTSRAGSTEMQLVGDSDRRSTTDGAAEQTNSSLVVNRAESHRVHLFAGSGMATHPHWDRALGNRVSKSRIPTHSGRTVILAIGCPAGPATQARPASSPM